MKTILPIIALTALLFVDASRSFALVGIEEVTKERAKELGVTFTTHEGGEAGVGVKIEFKKQGEMKQFLHARVEFVTAEKKKIGSAYVAPHDGKDGNVSVNFWADPEFVPTSIVTITVRTGESPRSMTGYRFKVKDFVEVKGK